jgi:hypothetical protein
LRTSADLSRWWFTGTSIYDAAGTSNEFNFCRSKTPVLPEFQWNYQLLSDEEH